jgi:acyl-CoA thioester hydrolase
MQSARLRPSEATRFLWASVDETAHVLYAYKVGPFMPTEHATPNPIDDNAKPLMHALLAEFPVVIEIPVAWGEMDAFQHVNNIVYFRYFESGRIAYFERAGLMEAMAESGVGPILASASCKFKFPLTYPDRVLVGTRVGEIGSDRFTMHFRIVSARHDRVAAEGDGVIVSYNYRTKQKAELPAEMRNRIEALEMSNLQNGGS